MSTKLNMTVEVMELVCGGCRGTGQAYDAEDEEYMTCSTCKGNGLKPPAPAPAGLTEDAMRFGDDVAYSLASVAAAGLLDAEGILRDKLLELNKMPAPAAPADLGRAPGLKQEMERLYALQSDLCQQHCGTAADKGIHTDGCHALINDLDRIASFLASIPLAAALQSPPPAPSHGGEAG